MIHNKLVTSLNLLYYRASHADFVVPYPKYVKSIKNPVTIGTRFKMKFEMDESPERRSTTAYIFSHIFPMKKNLVRNMMSSSYLAGVLVV